MAWNRLIYCLSSNICGPLFGLKAIYLSQTLKVIQDTLRAHTCHKKENYYKKIKSGNTML